MNPKQIAFGVSVAVVSLLGLFIVFGSWFQIDQGERGIVLRNGEIVRVAEPGLGFMTPILDGVEKITVRDMVFKFDKLEAYSYDQQPALIAASVTYRVPADQVQRLYSEYGSLSALQSRLLERRVVDEIKNVFGKFTAARSIQARAELGVDVNAAVRKAVEAAPVFIVGVQIEHVKFSSAYEQSIEQRMMAQVQIETTRQQKETAEVQAQIKVVQAKAEADAQREAYTAQADGIRLRGDAEAAAIRARAEALATNTNLVSLVSVEKWDGKLPVTQLPGSAMPFIGVK